MEIMPVLLLIYYLCYTWNEILFAGYLILVDNVLNARNGSTVLKESRQSYS